jgi:hypothetical protein
LTFFVQCIYIAGVRKQPRNPVFREGPNAQRF